MKCLLMDSVEDVGSVGGSSRRMSPYLIVLYCIILHCIIQYYSIYHTSVSYEALLYCELSAVCKAGDRTPHESPVHTGKRGEPRRRLL